LTWAYRWRQFFFEWPRIRHMKHHFGWSSCQISILGLHTRGDRTILRISSSLGRSRILAYDTLVNTLRCAIFQTIICIRWRHFQLIHMIHIVLVLMVSMFTSSNNMKTRHVQFLEFVIITSFSIQPNREISSGSNLSLRLIVSWTKNCVSHQSNSRTMWVFFFLYVSSMTLFSTCV